MKDIAEVPEVLSQLLAVQSKMVKLRCDLELSTDPDAEKHLSGGKAYRTFQFHHACIYIYIWIYSVTPDKLKCIDP